MPEGPEIRRAADVVADVLVGERIEKARFGLPRLRHHARKFHNATVVDVETRGKAMLTHFDNGWTIYSHNQLYGVWQVCPRDEWPPTRRSLRLELSTDQDSALLYSASDISVWLTREVAQHPFLAKLGPDILAPSLDWRMLAARLREDRFRGRTLSALYLDQSFLAGSGNYLRSEILFVAQLAPQRIAGELSLAERGRLARATLAIAGRSYRSGGITVTARLASQLRHQGLSYEELRFWVFGRAGIPCYSCGDLVQREQMNSRRLYWCPGCQQ